MVAIRTGVVEGLMLHNWGVFGYPAGMLILSHRGYCDRKTTENTLEGFARAVKTNADGIEFDLRVSRDGELVVIHDENLHRIAGDARRVRDLTADELQGVVLRGAGHIPTLNDITSSIPAPKILDMEIKDSDALPLLIAKLKTSAALRERTVVSSFVLDDLIRIREEVPDVRTISLNRNWPLLFRGKAFWSRLKAADVWAVGFPGNVLNSRRVVWLHRQGWKVAAWDLQPLKREARRVGRLRPDIAIVFRMESCA